jgi:hypothetical protein
MNFLITHELDLPPQSKTKNIKANSALRRRRIAESPSGAERKKQQNMPIKNKWHQTALILS